MSSNQSPMNSNTQIQQLYERLANGERIKYLFFWGHTGNERMISKECLSQWYPASFRIDGVLYKTAEHYMMAKKALLFGAEETAKQIVDCDHPGEAKHLGRTVPNFDESVWKRNRSDIVVAGNVAKFSQSKELNEYLRQTGERVLVEASPVDRIWGIGLGQDSQDAENPDQG